MAGHQVRVGTRACWLVETRENVLTGHEAKLSGRDLARFSHRGRTAEFA